MILHMFMDWTRFKLCEGRWIFQKCEGNSVQRIRVYVKVFFFLRVLLSTLDLGHKIALIEPLQKEELLSHGSLLLFLYETFIIELVIHFTCFWYSHGIIKCLSKREKSQGFTWYDISYCLKNPRLMLLERMIVNKGILVHCRFLALYFDSCLSLFFFFFFSFLW